MAQGGNNDSAAAAANAFAQMSSMGMPGLMMPPFMAAGAQGGSDPQFAVGMLNPFMMGGLAGFAQQNQGQNKTHGNDA